MDLVTYFQMLGFACLVGLWNIPAVLKMLLVATMVFAALRFVVRLAFAGHAMPVRQVAAPDRYATLRG